MRSHGLLETFLCTCSFYISRHFRIHNKEIVHNFEIIMEDLDISVCEGGRGGGKVAYLGTDLLVAVMGLIYLRRKKERAKESCERKKAS